MKKILFTLLVIAMLACPAMAQRYRQMQLTIVDEGGDPVTNIDQIEIYDAGTSTASTIYPTRAGGTMVNPITTSSTASSFVQSLGQVTWFQAAASYKVTIVESGASQSLTIDNMTSSDTRFYWYVNYIGEAATLQVTDGTTLDFGTSDNFYFDWDAGNTKLILASAADAARWDIGLAAVHTDIYWHTGAAITDDYVFFDEGSANVFFKDVDLVLDSSAVLFFGDSSDMSINYDESNNDLDVLSTSALDEISWGATGDGYDQIWHSTTAGDYMLFDYSEDALLLEDMSLSLGDAERVLLGGTVGTGSMFISVTSDVMEIGQVAALTGSLTFGNDDDGVDVTFYGDSASQKAWWDASGDEWFFGANAEGVDVTWYGDIASSYMKWDETAETHGAMIFEAADLHMMDADYVIFGDGSDFKIHSTTALKLNITPAAATDDFEVLFGSDQSGMDIKAFAKTASEYIHWDASADSLTVVGDLALFTMTGTTVPFRVDATGTVSSGNAIELETTDGKVLINADGGTYGDIELNSADDLIFTTAGKLTITNTEATTVSGDLTVTGTLTAVGAYVNPVEIVAATNEIEITESGTTFILNHGTEFATTLPTVASSAGVTFRFIVGVDPAGNSFTILTDTLEDKIEGSVVVDGANIEADGPDDTITFTASAAVVGDWVELTSDGVLWYLSGQGAAATSIVPTKAD